MKYKYKTRKIVFPNNKKWRKTDVNSTTKCRQQKMRNKFIEPNMLNSILFDKNKLTLFN